MSDSLTKDLPKLEPTLETEIEIEASPDDIWNALTDSEQLANWFPLDAKVTAPSEGADGSIWFSWGPDFEGQSKIEIWEPGKRLRTCWSAGSSATVDEFTIEALGGGKTKLRVVTQGFGKAEGWENNYDCMRKGWMFELRGMRFLLEKHRGQKRRVGWAQGSGPKGMALGEVWKVLLGSSGFALAPAIGALSAGDTFEATSADGNAMPGVVQAVDDKGLLVAEVGGDTPGLLRVELNSMGGSPDDPVTVWVWLSTYGVEESRVKGFQSSWEEKLGGMFASR